MRVAVGLTMTELSKGIVSRSAIGHYEAGDYNPSRLVLARLAKRLGCSMADFVDGSDEHHASSFEPAGSAPHEGSSAGGRD
jgi:transcriptional regulator with XRE-family HTH domain